MTVEFLEHVITTESGYFNLATLEAGKVWTDIWFKWPEQAEEIIEAANRYKSDRSVYFTPHLFRERRSTREAVLPSRTLAADLDYAAIPRELQPSILVETSPARHQGYWILKQEQANVDALELMSKNLTYAIPDCDKGCWQLGHKMRMPGTFNYKYKDAPEVKIIHSNRNTIRSLPLITQAISKKPTEDTWEPIELNLGPLKLLKDIKDKLPSKVYTTYGRVQTETTEGRSGALWALMVACFRAGLDRDHVYYLALHSANNKFTDNKYNAERDLKKDVIRAEDAAKKNSAASVRDQLGEVRKAQATVAEKRRLMAHIMFLDMSRKGTFMTTPAGEYFIRDDTGMPIYISRRSPWLDSYIEEQYWFNNTEPEQRYAVSYLDTSTKERGRVGQVAYLSSYNPDSKVVLLHTGKRDVLEIGANRINTVANGEFNILFPWGSNIEPFDLVKESLDFDHLLDGCFDNIIDMEAHEARAIIRAWFMFLFFRDAVIARPILALFGQPGSGKSTLFRRIYTLLYGRFKSVNSLTNADDFDHAVSHDPMVVFDNVDTWSSWLPDKLALSASTSDLSKRKLYTDNDTATLKRQALVGLTAHNPKFRREDIVDRLLLLNFHRLEKFKPEADILERIWKERDALWSGIAKDIQKILATPYPAEKDVPTFRISDFARIGLWTSRALGFETSFRSALAKNVQEQVAFNLEEESMLIDSLKLWLKRKPERNGKWVTVSELHDQLLLIAPDEFLKTYPRTLTLGRKLWSLQETLRSIFKIEYKTGAQREWKFELI